MRALRAEETLKGKTLDTKMIDQAAQVASQECNPRSSGRATAEYRREMVKVLVARALSQTCGGET
jgi:carbon-monoxide dehydrogenase medium subunit